MSVLQPGLLGTWLYGSRIPMALVSPWVLVPRQGVQSQAGLLSCLSKMLLVRVMPQQHWAGVGAGEGQCFFFPSSLPFPSGQRLAPSSQCSAGSCCFPELGSCSPSSSSSLLDWAHSSVNTLGNLCGLAS